MLIKRWACSKSSRTPICGKFSRDIWQAARILSPVDNLGPESWDFWSGSQTELLNTWNYMKYELNTTICETSNLIKCELRRHMRKYYSNTKTCRTNPFNTRKPTLHEKKWGGVEFEFYSEVFRAVEFLLYSVWNVFRGVHAFGSMEELELMRSSSFFRTQSCLNSNLGRSDF